MSLCPSLGPLLSVSRQPTHLRPNRTSPGPGLSLLFVNEVIIVQFQDMGVTIQVAPQEILTRQMKSHLWLYQASPTVEGRLWQLFLQGPF